MKLRDTLLKEHSKAQCNKIIKWIGKDQSRFDTLFRLFLNDESIVQQRAAWPMSYCVRAHPELIQKHLGKLLANLEKPGHHDAIKRNSLRLIQDIEIPKKYQGTVMDQCIRFDSSPIEKPAIKAFAMGVLEQLIKLYSEIKREIRTIIEDNWENESAAFRSRAKRILRT